MSRSAMKSSAPVSWPDMATAKLSDVAVHIDAVLLDGSQTTTTVAHWLSGQELVLVDVLHAAVRHQKLTAIACLWPLVRDRFDAVRLGGPPKSSSGDKPPKVNLINVYSTMNKIMLDAAQRSDWNMVCEALEHQEIQHHLGMGAVVACALREMPTAQRLRVWDAISETTVKSTIGALIPHDDVPLVTALIARVDPTSITRDWLRSLVMHYGDLFSSAMLDLLLKQVKSHDIGGVIWAASARLNDTERTATHTVPLVKGLVGWYRRTLEHDEDLVSAASYVAQWGKHDQVLSALASIMTPEEMLSAFDDARQESWDAADNLLGLMPYPLQTVLITDQKNAPLLKCPNGRAHADRQALKRALYDRSPSSPPEPTTVWDALRSDPKSAISQTHGMYEKDAEAIGPKDEKDDGEDDGEDGDGQSGRSSQGAGKPHKM